MPTRHYTIQQQDTVRYLYNTAYNGIVCVSVINILSHIARIALSFANVI